MKTSLLIGTTLAFLCFAGISSAATIPYQAMLDGAQEVPPVTTQASGSAVLAFDDATKKLTGTVQFSGVTASAAHIHTGAVGMNGGVAHALSSTSPIAVDVTLTPQEETDLAASGLYINIHSDAEPGGEIRGQIVPVSGSTDAGGGGTDAGTGTDTGAVGDDASTPGDSGGGGGGSDSGGGGGSDSGGGGGGGGGLGGGGGGGTGDGGSAKSDGGAGAAPADKSGCSSTGAGSASGGLTILAGLGIALGAIARSRKAKR